MPDIEIISFNQLVGLILEKLDQLGPSKQLAKTDSDIAEILTLHRNSPVCNHPSR